ncbi:MFS transporter [Asanoa ishikariensis]|uniref:Predicted arabinose efflux permease, MFS family n=1 Tax=Asanoa ishikariensis TaxID=137265 RepID=A0A1H3RV75_9ACTN|nr:MFS transporter [Asanoa ishikariensis]GIF66820.1 MFS transporter [Asanoa ishikariensis]SDZ29208.1 Predicted arabinose efflux permease, MFS family [Asanoa ishikariensis]
MGHALRRYRDLLRTPGVVRIAVPSLVGRLPIGMLTLLFVLVVAAGTGSYGAAGLATAANSALTALVGPVLGRLADRGWAVGVLVWCGVVQAALLVALVLALRAGAPAWTAILLAGLAGAVNPPIDPVTRAVLPRIAPKHVHTAFALDAIAIELTYVVGPALVGLITALADAYAATLVAAAVTVAGSIGLATAPPVRRGWPAPPATRRRVSPVRSSGMLVVLAVAGLASVAYGLMEVAIPAHAAMEGHADQAGLLVAVWSAGSIAGGLWYAGRTFRTPPWRQYGILMLGNVVGFGVILLQQNLWSLAVLLLFAGLFIAPTTTLEFTLVAQLTPDESRAEAFTWANTAVYLGFAAGSALAGTALEPVLGTPDGLLVAGACAVGVVAVGALVAWGARGALRPR